MVSDLWGQRHFGTNMAVINIVCFSNLHSDSTQASACGGYIFPNFVAGRFYNKYSQDGGKNCSGRECFHDTYAVCTGATLGAIFAVVILYIFSYRTYKNKQR